MIFVAAYFQLYAQAASAVEYNPGTQPIVTNSVVRVIGLYSLTSELRRKIIPVCCFWVYDLSIKFETDAATEIYEKFTTILLEKSSTKRDSFCQIWLPGRIYSTWKQSQIESKYNVKKN